MPRDILGANSSSGGAPAPGPWTDYPLANGWAKLSGWPDPKYRINGDMVELKGFIDGGSATGHMAALPAPARPAVIRRLLLLASGGAHHADMQVSGVLTETTTGPLTPAGFYGFDGCTYSLTA